MRERERETRPDGWKFNRAPGAPGRHNRRTAGGQHNLRRTPSYVGPGPVGPPEAVHPRIQFSFVLRNGFAF